MKTKIKTLLLVTILSCVLFPKTTTAQTPSCYYTIFNNMYCAVTVTVDYYNSGGLCDSQATTCSTGPNYFTCAGTCGTLTNIVVTAYGFSVDINNTMNGVMSGVPSPSCSDNGGATMTWGPSSTGIQPQ